MKQKLLMSLAWVFAPMLAIWIRTRPGEPLRRRLVIGDALPRVMCLIALLFLVVQGAWLPAGLVCGVLLALGLLHPLEYRWMQQRTRVGSAATSEEQSGGARQ